MTTHGPAYWEGPESAPPDRVCGWSAGGEPAVARLGVYGGPEPPPHWTVIAGSFETREEAERLGGQLCLAGFQDAEILYSSDFANLNPGWWVAYSGIFRDRASAAQHARYLQARGFGGAYPRWVSR